MAPLLVQTTDDHRLDAARAVGGRKRRHRGGRQANVWPLLESGAVKPIIHATFPLRAAADAHRLMESSQHIGKIVLVRMICSSRVVLRRASASQLPADLDRAARLDDRIDDAERGAAVAGVAARAAGQERAWRSASSASSGSCPIVVFSMISGVVADAWNRRQLMLFTQTGSALVVAGARRR